jgi:steroid delta-isomerase-like uncharacterized protein
MSSDNAALVTRWFEEVWNQRRAAAIDEVVAAESLCHTDAGTMRGPEEFRRQQFEPFLAAFPDLKVDVEAVIAQDDQVAVRWNATGTHGGDGLGCAPTGRQVTFRGITWIVVRDGQFREGWQSSDISPILKSLAGS